MTGGAAGTGGDMNAGPGNSNTGPGNDGSAGTMPSGTTNDTSAISNATPSKR